MLCLPVYVFFIFLLAITMSILRFKTSDYPFDIFKLFISIQEGKATLILNFESLVLYNENVDIKISAQDVFLE